MSKELDYEINNFANLLHKDCMNLMECLKKQSEDNKPILYLGKHYEKVILPYKEYQKMCKRLEEQEKKTYSDELKLVEKKLHLLESIDNAEPSEAIKHMEFICKILKEKGIDVKWVFKEDYNTIIQSLQRLGRYEKILGSGRLTDRNYKNTTLDLDSCKPYLRLGQLEDIYEGGK